MFIFIICIFFIAALLIVAVLLKDLLPAYQLLKNYKDVFFSKSPFYYEITFFIFGALISFLLSYFFFFIRIYLFILAIQYFIVFLFIQFSEKKHEHTSKKQLWYFLGCLFSFIYKSFIMLLKLGYSKNAFSISLHFAAIIGLIIYYFYINKKENIMKNTAATSFAEGRITEAFLTEYGTKQISYRYEYTVNGKLWKGIDSEAYKRMKNRGAILQGQQRILYVVEKPEMSWLCAIDHSRKVPAFLIIIFVILLIIFHCIIETDVIQTIERLLYLYEEYL